MSKPNWPAIKAARDAALRAGDVKDRQSALLHMIEHKDWYLRDTKIVDAYEFGTEEILVTKSDFLAVLSIIQPRPTTASRLSRAWKVLLGKEE